MQEENKKVPSRSKTPERTRATTYRRCKDREKSVSKLILPVIVPQTRTQTIQIEHSDQRDGVHFIIRIPHKIVGKQFSQVQENLTIRARKIDLRMSQNTNEAFGIQIKLNQSSTISQGSLYMDGKCYYITNQIESKTIEVKKKINKEYTMIFKHKVKEAINSDVFFDIVVDVSQPQSRAYKGIVNQGNTCYMNSYLQVLYHIQKFRQLIFDLEPTAQDKFPRTFQNMFYELTSESVTKQVGTEELSKSYGWTKKEVDVQQDIQQFSCVLLEAVEKKVKQQANKDISDKFYSIFQGEYNNYIQCLDVNYRSNRVDTFQDIQLSVHNVSNLMDSLHQYFEAQIMEGDNIYKTDDYGPQRAAKGIQLKKLPEVLFIHLKRFDFDAESEMHGKIMSKYSYPSSIDFTPFFKQHTPPSYQLYGVVVHDGSKCNSGHYYSFVKIKNKWFKFNDQIVTPATEKEVFQDNFGGTENLLNFDNKQFLINMKQKKIDSTAYMLIYYNSSLQKQLFKMPNVIPQWMKQQRLQEEAERSKQMEQVTVQVVDWVSIKTQQTSSCGIILQVDSLNGEFRQTPSKQIKLRQSYPLNSFIDFVARKNNVDPKQITCWVFENFKGKQLFVNPYSIKQNPTISDLFKNKQNNNNTLLLFHENINLVDKLQSQRRDQDNISAGNSQDQVVVQIIQTEQNKNPAITQPITQGIPPTQPSNPTQPINIQTTIIELNETKAQPQPQPQPSFIKPKQNDQANNQMEVQPNQIQTQTSKQPIQKDIHNDIFENNAIVVVIKLFTIDKDHKQSFRFINYLYGNKQTKFSDIQSLLNMIFMQPDYRVNYFKQKKKAFDVEKVKEDQCLLDNNTRNRVVVLIVQQISTQLQGLDYLLRYLEAQSNKIIVTLINLETQMEYDEYLRRDMTVDELRKHIYDRHYEHSYVQDFSYINIKYRIQKSQRKYEEAYNGAATIEVLLKYQKSLFFSASIIKAEERQHSAIFTMVYRNNYNFNYSPAVNVVLPKTSDLKAIINAVTNEPIIKNYTYKDTHGVRLLHIDESMTKILRIFHEDDDVWMLWNKYKGYLVLDGMLNDPKNVNVIVAHNKTKDHYFIGTPFVIQVFKEELIKDILFSILECVRKMKLQFDDKVHELNKNKLKIFLSSDSQPKSILVDKENEENELSKLYPQDGEFYIDIMHLSISSPFQAMKIHLDA